MTEENYAFILLCDEKWWNKLCEHNRKNQNKTHSFVRRNLRGPLKAEKLLFYVKSPVKQIRGTADFVERVAGDSEKLWRKYGSEKATFVRFKNFRELENPIPAKTMKKVLGVLKVPRGGKYINRETTEQLAV